MTQHQVDTFIRHALPGMALRANPYVPSAPRARPLVKRCGYDYEGTAIPCRRPVSDNKRACRSCWEFLKATLKAKMAQKLAAMPEDQWIPLLLGLDPELRPELPEGYEMAYDITTNQHLIRKN